LRFSDIARICKTYNGKKKKVEREKKDKKDSAIFLGRRIENAAITSWHISCLFGIHRVHKVDYGAAMQFLHNAGER